MSIYDNRVFQVYADLYGDDYGTIGNLGVYFITDKQSAFEMRMWIKESNWNNDEPNHPEIINSIDKKIYDESIINEFDDTYRRKYNAYIYLYKDHICNLSSFLIAFPENGILSISQAAFLCKALDELMEYNKYEGLSDDKCASISLLAGSKDYNDINVEKAKKIIKGFVNGFQEFHKEEIIGQVLNNEDIVKMIRQYIDFSKCNNINDLINIMDLCEKYYQDNYYHAFFINLFPNYLEVNYLVNEIKKLNVENMTFSGLSFDNIYGILNGIYDNYRVSSSDKKHLK